MSVFVTDAFKIAHFNLSHYTRKEEKCQVETLKSSRGQCPCTSHTLEKKPVSLPAGSYSLQTTTLAYVVINKPSQDIEDRSRSDMTSLFYNFIFQGSLDRGKLSAHFCGVIYIG